MGFGSSAVQLLFSCDNHQKFGGPRRLVLVELQSELTSEKSWDLKLLHKPTPQFLFPCVSQTVSNYILFHALGWPFEQVSMHFETVLEKQLCMVGIWP